MQAGCRVRVRFHGRLVDGFVWELAGDAPSSPAPSSRCRTSRRASRCSPRRWRGWPGSSPTGTPARSATSCGSRCRPAGPARRSGRRPTPDALPGRPRPGRLRPLSGRPGAAHRPRRGAARRGRSGPRCRGRTGRPGWSSCAGPRCRDGAGALVVVPDGKDLDRLAAAAVAAPAGALVHRAARRRLAGEALPAVPRRLARRGPGRARHPGGDVRAGPRPRPGGGLGRRRRPALRRAARPIRTPATSSSSGPGSTTAPPWSRARSRTAEAALLVESGWAHELVADRAVLRSSAAPGPGARATTSSWPATPPPGRRGCPRWRTRPPARRWPRARRCWCRCRGGATSRRWPAPGAGRRPGARTAPGRWASRRGPARAARGSRPAAGVRGPAATFDCPHCHGTKLRAAVVGESRTAEELARAFPGATVRTSGQHVRGARDGAGGPVARRRHPGRRAGRRGRLRRRPAAGLLGAARPGRPAGGGGDAAPLDERGHAGAARRRPAGRSWSRPTPRIPSSRRWCAGTRRWLAERELADRRELGFPPVTRIASLSGSPAALAEFLDALRLPADADLLGPVPEPPRPGQEGERERYLVRVPRGGGRCAGARARRGPGRAQREEGARARARAAGPARPRLTTAPSVIARPPSRRRREHGR